MSKHLPTLYQQYIHQSRYARYNDELGRRETWEETVSRYITYFKSKVSTGKTKVPWDELEQAILNLEVMPSMRCLMTAGEALDVDQAAGYNCSYLPIDNVKAFDELMYILMCFEPDTQIKTHKGPVAISQLKVGDEVLSFVEDTREFVWRPVTAVVETPSADLPKLAITLENGQVIKCTANHKWLTVNRGWVVAGELTLSDDLVAPLYVVYRVINTNTGKSYVGFTSRTVEARFKEHIKEALYEGNERYNSHFHRAIRKDGDECWLREVIDYAYSLDEVKNKEKHWIALLDSKNDGYNSTDGGEGTNGYRWTKEQRRRASENAYERTPNHRARQSEVLRHNQDKIKAIRGTLEYREQQRLRNIGPNNPRFGHRYSEVEREQKRQEAKKRQRDVSGRFI